MLEAARQIPRTLADLAVPRPGGGSFRLTDHHVRAALAPPGAATRDTPFAWSARTARRALGLAGLRALVTEAARSPIDGVTMAIDDAVRAARQGDNAASPMDRWLAGLSPASRAAVQAGAVTWATRLWCALDWTAFEELPTIGRDHWWDSPHSSLLALRSRAEVRSVARDQAGSPSRSIWSCWGDHGVPLSDPSSTWPRWSKCCAPRAPSRLVGWWGGGRTLGTWSPSRSISRLSMTEWPRWPARWPPSGRYRPNTRRQSGLRHEAALTWPIVVAPMKNREDIRNVAIVAHVDHGKTTLVDAMLRQTGAFGAHQEVTDRVMDSGDLEREKGITILAKNTAVRWGGVKMNIVDTPGHADFGGEVERGLTMVDGVLLLVDASEGPLPQTRFVLRKALEARLPVVLVINKVDRADARIEEVVDQVEELFLDLDADEHQISFPILYSNARAGWVSTERGVEGTDVAPLFQAIIDHVPAPQFDETAPTQALVCNLSASPYVGRLAICRVYNGELKKGGTIAWCKIDGTIEKAKITEMYVTESLEQVPADAAGPGEIVSIAGLAEVTIGETLADADNPIPLPAITVDEPSLAMTIGINTSPLSGADGTKLTARLLKNRLDSELVGNVAIRVAPTDRPDLWEVMGRGELQLAVLVETMRREGFELTVGKPQVVTREEDGKVLEPVERVSIDVPDDYLGVVTQLLSLRKGTMTEMVNHGTGWVRLDYRVPARGLIGFRTEFLTETRGTGVLHHIFDGWEPWHGDLKTRRNGSMVADRRGLTTTFALMNLQERGTLIVGPAEEVYEGMVIGENARQEEMDVNPTKEKKLNNIRSSTAEEFSRLTPVTIFSLEHALEFISDDECVEVTPKVVRLRKVILPQAERGRLRGRLRDQNASDSR